MLLTAVQVEHGKYLFEDQSFDNVADLILFHYASQVRPHGSSHHCVHASQLFQFVNWM
jgi:hypothetical protein